ncbi:ribonuclease HII [Staphylothermus hellenicus]|uniref:Ribonuclease n=1 Tax=Staphylothermus hellenicus (strain DSM 12710 / JCM 10830 / BK20S6-10-b1 / P8) TaxID=591019 RepID=D7D923_STAHD|nr:ribonuclease HII [Staphylothermus hellenicus]ADI32269.1 ribonuclease HII [Staphylothermus hellenicus DSM 12710]
MGKNIHALNIGVDEAGRGPLIGDLVIAILIISRNKIEKLISIGVKDSKQLTRHTRLSLAKKILKLADSALIIYISPEIIDSYNINRIIAEKIILALKLFSPVINHYRTASIYIDEIKGYKNYILANLSKYINNIEEYVMEPNADQKYPVVSAASILAKTIRDKNIDFLKKIYGNLGSGYPSDRVTINWLIKTYNGEKEPPLIIRRTWSTLRKYAPKWFSNLKNKRTLSILDYLGDRGNGDESSG